MENTPPVVESAVNLENPKHPIRETLLANIFFEEQSNVEREGEEEGIGNRGDFKETFRRTARSVDDFFSKKGLPKLRIGEDKVEEFFEEFLRIKMDDTIYHDLASHVIVPFSDIAKRVDGLAIWSSGDPAYQPKKIALSGIEKLVDIAKEEQEQSGRSVFTESVISQKKDAEIPGLLKRFYDALSAEKKPSRIKVIIYDDSVGNFEKADKYIKEFEDAQGIKVEREYIFAKVGRVTEEKETEQKEMQVRERFPFLKTITDVSELANSLSPSEAPTLVMLDFDGALSDNRLMRARQAHIAYKHIMKHLKSLVQGHAGWDERDEKTAEGMRDHIKKMYAQIDSLWKNKKVSEGKR